MGDYYDDDEAAELYDDRPARTVRFARPDIQDEDDEEDSVGGDYVPIPVPGTVNRPLIHVPNADDRQFAGSNTVRWGDRRTIIVPVGTGTSITEFLRVALPTARVCSLSLHAEFVSGPGTPFWTAFELFLGVGSTQIVRRIGFSTSPAPGVPLDYVVEMLPLNSIHIRATLVANPVTEIIVAAQLSPIESVA
jgi:hypothetical protein